MDVIDCTTEKRYISPFNWWLAHHFAWADIADVTTSFEYQNLFRELQYCAFDVLQGFVQTKGDLVKLY